MRELRDICSLEERNGLNEAIYLLEQRVSCGCKDKATVLKLLFLYWYMETEPKYMTNDKGTRDWGEWFANLLQQCGHLEEDIEFNWVAGYLMRHFPKREDFHTSGKSMLQKATILAPEDPIPNALWQLETENQQSSNISEFNWEERFTDWGMLKDYFEILLKNSHIRIQ